MTTEREAYEAAYLVAWQGKVGDLASSDAGDLIKDHTHPHFVLLGLLHGQKDSGGNQYENALNRRLNEVFDIES